MVSHVSNSLPGQPREWADDALRGYLSDPVAAGELAARARIAASAERDWSAASVAERALGLIAGHLSDSAAAQRHLQAAIRLGRRASDPPVTALARLDLAYVLVRRGRSTGALRQIAAAEPDLPDAEARSLLQMRAMVFKSLGRLDEALASYARALPLTRTAGDDRELAVLLGNRGVLHLHRGDTRMAERDLEESDAIFATLGADLSRAIMAHNLGYVAALRGDVPLALRRYDDAESGYARHREIPLELWRDRCELLLEVGLAAEALDAADRAVQAATARHEPAELAEAQLRLAQARLAEGNAADALGLAVAARRALARQGRSNWAALARWIGQRAQLSLDATSVTAAGLRRTAAQLQAAGWKGAALEARLTAGQVAAATGRTGPAQQDLTIVGRARAAGPMWHRQAGWHAEALRRAVGGDRTGALRAAARGMAIVEEHRATLGATDLRASASRRVSALAEMGMELAVDGGRPETVLRWAELTRAAALLHPPARPPHDEQVSQTLGELRYVVRQRQEAVTQARTDRALLRRQVQLEEQVRRLVRQAEGSGRTDWTRVDVDAIKAALRDQALIEFATVRGRLLAVVAADGRVRIRRVGDGAAVAGELEHLLFALRRMSTGRPDPSGARRARLLAAADRLDRALLAPVADIIGDRPLVIVPTEPLHSLPWAILPSCRGRVLSVCPSATLFHKVSAGGPPPAPAHALLVAGPRLAHAVAEVTAIATRYEHPRVLVGADARVATVLEAITEVPLVHLAAHGTFRRDNPLFSAIELADGPLTGYDLERLPRSPTRAVLSACDTGRPTAVAGGEVLGLAATMLGIGVRSVVAPLLPISDEATVPLMVRFHEGLRSGLPTAVALARATDEAVAGSDSAMAAGVSFVCVGA
jgi:tetratricopeptide (TPR) repeat protein